MRPILLILFALIFKSSIAQDYFDTEQIRTIEITFTQTNWDDILDTYYSAGSDLRLVGTLSLDGEVFDSVGVRYKGNSSYDASRIKNPFNIKLDYVKGKQDIDGRNVLKLSNVFRDPSFVREVLSYEMARKYMPASAANFAKVYVNGSYIGLYVNDESTNQAFASKHYFKSKGPFFEGDFSPGTPPTGCASGTPKVWGYLGTDPTCYEQYYAIQSNNANDWNELIAALDTFNNYTNAIENAIYIDRLLWMLAIDNVLVNLDSPLGPPHNFLLYKDKTDRFNPMLWDLNQSFGSFTGMGSTSFTPTQLKEFDPWYNESNTNYPIISIPFQNAQYKKMYIAKMKTIFEENLSNNLYSERIATLQNLIASDVSNDNNKFYTTSEFTQNVNSTVDGVIGLEELMSDRISFLSTHADFIKTAPSVNAINHFPPNPTANSTLNISAEISNANLVFLGYRFSPKEKFIKIPMTENAGIYSASINLGLADIEYYIWAENNDAGIFSPPRAEYEFHRIGVSADLVINELQASNKTTQFDEATQYDDWIEIYNNSNSTIDLTGYFLTDNKDTLTKWAVPSQSLAADDYLIFWADKDEAQGSNHTNFKLTRNGESVYLVNPSGQIVDQITYPHILSDSSYARFPNGTGAFVQRTPTFDANNGKTDSTLAIDNLDQVKFAIFPNPSKEIIYISASKNILVGSNIQIFDYTGKLLITKKWTNGSVEELNIEKLGNGIYFIQIENQVAIKFVKN